MRSGAGGFPSEPARQTRGAGVAFEHVVAGHQVHRPASSAGAAVDDRHEVATRQCVHLGERLASVGGDRADVEPGGAEQRRHQIDVRGRRRHGARRRSRRRRCARSTNGTRVASS